MTKLVTIIILFVFTFGSPVFSNPKGKGLWCVAEDSNLVTLKKNPDDFNSIGISFFSETAMSSFKIYFSKHYQMF